MQSIVLWLALFTSLSSAIEENLRTRDLHTCTWPYVYKDGLCQYCANDYICPENSSPIPYRTCYDSFYDCTCDYGFYKSFYEDKCISYWPTHAPTRPPTHAPIRPPTNAPVKPPTKEPIKPPTNAPVKPPTNAPVKPPTNAPVKPPTNAPVKPPTNAPVKPPTNAPVKPPTKAPIKPPTNAPVKPPTKAPVKPPTKAPIKPPTNAPVKPPTKAPITPPTNAPVKPPTNAPVKPPTKAPIKPPTNAPVKPPTKAPVKLPTNAPVKLPTRAPKKPPTNAPVRAPTNAPINPQTRAPIRPPTRVPIKSPTNVPVKPPTKVPVRAPTNAPIKQPIRPPTKAPVKNTSMESTMTPTFCKIPQFTESSWQLLSPDYPMITEEPQGLIIGNDIIQFSGYTELYANATNHTFAKDISIPNRPWRRMEDVPAVMGLTHAPTVAIGTKVYICGGYNGTKGGLHVPDCFVYDHSKAPRTGQWSRLPNLPHGGSGGGGMIYDRIRNALYYSGGAQRFTLGSTAATDVNNTYRYSFGDPDAGWVETNAMPYKGNHLSYVTHTDENGRQRHFFLGGQKGEFECCRNLAHNFEFIAATEKWVRRASMRLARGHASASTRPIGCGFIIAGGSVNGENNLTSRTRTADVSYYDIPTDTWTSIGALPSIGATPLVDIHSNGYMYFSNSRLSRRRISSKEEYNLYFG